MGNNGYELAAMRFGDRICIGLKIKAWGPEVGFQERKWVTTTIKSWCFGGLRSFSSSGFSPEEVSVKLGLWKKRFMGTLCLVSLTNLCPFALTNLVKSSEEEDVFALLRGFRNQGSAKIGPRNCFVGLLPCRVWFGIVYGFFQNWKQGKLGVSKPILSLMPLGKNIDDLAEFLSNFRK